MPRTTSALASIFDADASIRQEKPLVASVLLNRLNKGMKLQVDSTVIYGIVGGKGVLGRALTRADIGTP
ncbi:MAG: endolytic transglycosylase MltG, partial [Armatimonadetes bacterium]|nr:endolytic transglycosylase MltG [Armatimonadota bacterium]